MIWFNYEKFILLIIIEFIDLDLWILFTCEIIVLGAIISLTSRGTDKILRGLQGTAATTIIARGIHDAYKSWKGSDSTSEKDDSKDKTKKEENKPKPVVNVTENNEK